MIAKIVALAAAAAADTYTKVSLAGYKDALCLDGSPGIYYLRKTGSPNWYIHYEGGGWCNVRAPFAQGQPSEPCVTRSTGHTGTTTQDGDTCEYQGDYFDSDQKINPTMHDWNRVVIRYCDGGSFSGMRMEPYSAPTFDPKTFLPDGGKKDLYFRGHFISRAVMADLAAHHQMNDATIVVISGGSAGGLSTYLHADDWVSQYRKLGSKTQFVAMPDGGFFYDATEELPQPPGAMSYDEIMRGNFEDFQAEGGVNADCVKAMGQWGRDKANCYFAQYTASFVTTPLFALQSPYDAWQIGNEVDAGASDLHIRAYGERVVDAIKTALFNPTNTRNAQNGGFINYCKYHCGMWNLKMNHNGEDIAMNQAFDKWLNVVLSGGDASTQRYWDNLAKYPCDECCQRSDAPTPTHLDYAPFLKGGPLFPDGAPRKHARQLFMGRLAKL